MDESNQALACYILSKTHLLYENKEACKSCLEDLKKYGDSYYSNKLATALDN